MLPRNCLPPQRQSSTQFVKYLLERSTLQHAAHKQHGSVKSNPVTESTESTESLELTVTTAEPRPDHIKQHLGHKKFNGLDGEYGKNASLWLANMEYYRNKESSPSMHLQHIDRHLEGEAAKWVSSTQSVAFLIHKGIVDVATEYDIDVFYGALIDRFHLSLEESQNLRGADPRSRFLGVKQRASESLEQYTRRFGKALSDIHNADNKKKVQIVNAVSVDGLTAQYALGLSNEELRDRLCQQHIHHQFMNLGQCQMMVEATTRIIDAENKAKARKPREQKRIETKKCKRTTSDEKSDGEDKEGEKRKKGRF